jgi:hypothetical protein
VPIELLLAKAEAPDRVEPPVLKTRVRNGNGALWAALPMNHECVPDFFTNGLDEFSRILSKGAISSALLNNILRALRSWFTDLAAQSVSKSHDILFCDLAHGFIRSPTEKLQKLFQTPLIKSMVDEGGLCPLGP